MIYLVEKSWSFMGHLFYINVRSKIPNEIIQKITEVDGVVHIDQRNRYSYSLLIGKMFTPEDVLAIVGRILEESN